VIDLSTNGLLSETVYETMEKSVRSCPKVRFEVGISIDGRPKVHERIRNMSGCWNKTFATWGLMRKLSSKYDNIGVHGNFTVNPWNVGELPQFCEEFPEISPLSVSLYHLGHSFKNTLSNPPDSRFYKEAGADISWFLDHGVETSLVKGLFLRLALQYLRDPSRQVVPCEACNASCFVSAEGNVYPCSLLEF